MKIIPTDPPGWCCGRMGKWDECDGCISRYLYLQHLETVLARVSEEWKIQAVRSFHLVMDRQDTFTTDDVWADLYSRDVEEPGGNSNSAMGGITQKLLADDWFYDTGDAVHTKRPSARARNIPIYRVKRRDE